MSAYEMRISDWSSDVCSSDLRIARDPRPHRGHRPARRDRSAGRRVLDALAADGAGGRGRRERLSGPQPARGRPGRRMGRGRRRPPALVALWPVEILRTEVAKTVASGDFAVHALQARMGMMPVRLAGLRFGNLNTPDDLAVAGITP